jgi:Tfp pilus assembly protein PilN
MSRVNLLPTEIKKGQQVRRRTLLVALIGAAVIGVIILLWVFQSVRLSQVNSDIEAQDRNNQSLQQEIADLQKYADIQAEAQLQEDLLASAYANEVAYSGVLVDVSKVIPNDTYLTQFSSSTTAPTQPTSTSSTETTFVGTMTFAGSSLHFDSLSVWLTRLEEVQGWANPWMSNISQAADTPGAYSFDTSVDLTQDALTKRGLAGSGGAGG